MPKLYVLSDIHGFYNEMREALDKAGFDPNDENSWLISCGDEMDRGNQPLEVMNYLMSLPRAIFVKGNHTTLMEELINRGYPLSYDWSNGTAQTVLDLAPNANDWRVACSVAYEKTKPFFDKEIDYFETANYIFVHSFIPLKTLDTLPKYYTKNRQFEFDPDWRYAHASEWEDARWGNPFKLAKLGFLPDKTLVFGHFHTSWPRHKYDGEDEFGEGADFSIYYGDGYIGIDGCTACTHKINLLVLEDDFLEDSGNEY